MVLRCSHDHRVDENAWDLNEARVERPLGHYAFHLNNYKPAGIATRLSNRQGFERHGFFVHSGIAVFVSESAAD